MSTLVFVLSGVSSVAIAFVVFGNIFHKAGFPRWYGIGLAVPFVNIVMLVWFAFTTWPIEQRLLKKEFGDSPAAIWRNEV